MGFLISSPASILNYKKAARAASVANVALSGGATLTIDGVSLSNLDRVLLKNQTLPAENGIYEITGLGTAYALARSSDANSSSAFKINMAVAISEGAVNADKIFQITSDVPIDLGVTSITFTAIDSAALVAVAAEQARAIAAEALALQKSSNLSDLASVGTAKTNLSLQNVDNTSDANKPVSSAQQTALNLKADLISPVFTTPNIGSATGSISGNAATVTTNANLTGPVTSSGNATAIANAAISNAMLANAAVANLSGTNTGDNSAASLVPSQASQANKVLATDGTTSSWQYAGLGAGSLGTNNIILGAAMPVGFTSNACLLIGHTPPLLRYGGGYNQDMNVIIGNGATLTGIYTRATVAVGASAVVQAEGDVAVGASASANNGVAIGSNVSSGSGGVAIASSSGLRGVCIGKSANNGVDGVSIGNTSRHYGSESVGIGANVGGYNTGTRTTSVGFRAGGGGVGTTEYVPTNNSAFFGAYAGAYCKNVHNELFIDTLDRSTYANQQTKSLLYGTFNATASSQTLRINAKVSSGNGTTTYVLSPFESDEGNSSTSIDLDLSLGASVKVTMTGNATFTFSNPTTGGAYLIKLVQDATGTRTVTWPATVKWSGGTAPTLTTTATYIDIINLYYDGTNYYGSSVLNFAP